MLTNCVFNDEKKLWEVSLFGDIDLYNVEELESALSAITDGDVHINCEELSYLDSTGLGVLVSLLNRCRDNGKSVTITALKPHILRIFKLTNLEKLFNIEA